MAAAWPTVWIIRQIIIVNSDKISKNQNLLFLVLERSFDYKWLTFTCLNSNLILKIDSTHCSDFLFHFQICNNLSGLEDTLNQSF